MTRGSYRVISSIGYNWEYHVWLTVKVHLACQENGILLHPVWKGQSEKEMVVVDRGSRGPCNGLEEFQLDFNTMADICQSQFFTFDTMATRLNRVCKKYFSKAAEVEAAGKTSLPRRGEMRSICGLTLPLICLHT